MNKLIWILFSLFLLNSCEEKTYRWVCDHVVSTRTPPSTDWITQTTQVEYCDKTEGDIGPIIIKNTIEGTNLRSSMTCKKE